MEATTLIVPEEYYLITYTFDKYPSDWQRYPRVVKYIGPTPIYVVSQPGTCYCWIPSLGKNRRVIASWYQWEKMTLEEAVAYQLGD